MNGWQDEHAEKDLKENQRGSGQDSPATRCPLEQELLGRHLQWHGKGKAPVRFEATHGDDSPCSITTLELRSCAITGPHAEWLAGGVLTQCRALVHLDFSVQSHRRCRGREASSFVAWSSLLSSFIGTLHCLLVAICLADRQPERATVCTHTAWQPSALHFGLHPKKSE